ncbi:MAG: PQQ-like beta-propeller repeat protein [Gemmatimonadaceae bacterium]|nr:PQQ-like beta-propeller repeat protein [Gemmatimonadaceae bacterium]
MFDRSSGRQLWERVLPGDGPGQPARCWSAAILTDGVVIAGSSTGRVYGLDSATGAIRWRTEPLVPLTPPNSDFMAIVETASGILVTTTGRVLLLVDPLTGAVRWRREFFSLSSFQPFPAAIGDVAAVTGFNGEFLLVDAATGAARVTTGTGAVLPSADRPRRRFLVTALSSFRLVTP